MTASNSNERPGGDSVPAGPGAVGASNRDVSNDTHVKADALQTATRQRVPSLSPRFPNVLVFLLFLHLWLASSDLKEVQIAVELILGVWLSWLAIESKLKLSEVLLVITFVAAMAAASVTNEPVVTLLNAKIYGLAVLSLIVFSKFTFDMRVASVILTMNLVLTVYQTVIGDPAPIAWLMRNVAGTFRGLVNSRPSGLFMGTHQSASLTALFLLWLGYKRRLFGLGVFVMVGARSFFNLAAYVGQLGANLLVLMRLERVAWVLGLIAVLVVLYFAKELEVLDLTSLSSIFTRREQIGYEAIVGQALVPESYIQAFTLLPADSKKLAGEIFAGWDFGNEIGWFTLMQQGGLVLCAIYLAILFSRIRGFKAFLALSLLHYGLATTPVAVFLMVQWSASLRARRFRAQPAPRESLRFYWRARPISRGGTLTGPNAT